VAKLLLSSPNNPSTFCQESIVVTGVLRDTKSVDGYFSVLIDGKDCSIQQIETETSEAELKIRATCHLPSLIPNSESEQKNYLVQLAYKSESETLLSEPTTITFLPREKWDRPMGGFIFPTVALEFYHDNYLVIEGWAVKLGSIQKRVVVRLNGREFECPKINIWSLLVGRTLPSIEGAKNAHFSLVLERSDLGFSLNGKSLIEVEIEFTDGTKFSLPPLKFKWKNEQSSRKSCISKPANRILFISNNLRSTEGAPKVLNHIIKNTVSKSREIAVISPVGGDLETELSGSIQDVHIFPDLYLAHYSRLADFERQTRQAQKFIDEFSPSLVFGNTIESFWAISYAQNLGIKTLWLIHESVDPKIAFEELDPQARIKFLTALDNADKLIFVSETTKKLFRSKKRSSAVIPNGVIPFEIEPDQRLRLRQKARQELDLPDSTLMILIVGTICQRKGHDFLVEALAKLQNSNFKAVFVGAREGDFLTELKIRIRDLNLSDKIVLVEETKVVDHYYAAADIFTISSREESAPLVSLEAMNWSLPIVSTDAFGLKEQLKRSGAALLSEVGDIEAFVKNLQRMLDDEGFRKECGKKGKAWVEKNFNLQDGLRKFEKLIGSSLQ
jgi:glycosyltransferase involved in cell wall biosynthesis